jgi:uncharacterized protein (DUF362 family)
MEPLGGMACIVAPGEAVLIKPNNVVGRYMPGTVTSAEIVAGLAKLVVESGGKPFIGENDLDFDPVAECFMDSCARHYRDALDRVGLPEVPLVNLSKDEQVSVDLPGAKVFKNTRIARRVLEADKIIDAPVMKTHDQTQITLGIKNLKGLLPVSQRRRSHSLGVEQAIVDLCAYIRPALVVIDGTTAAEGMGPTGGTPFRMDLVVASANALAADMVGATIMGFDFKDIHFIRYGVDSHLGPRNLDDIEVLGLPIAAVRRPFVTAQSVVLEQYRQMGIEVVAHNACSGCWAEFRHIYYSLGDQRGKVAGLRFVLGQVRDLSPGPKTIVVGSCAKAVAGCGRFVEGCPPQHSQIEAAVCAEADIDPAKIDTYM